jgi:hypothetical protein
MRRYHTKANTKAKADRLKGDRYEGKFKGKSTRLRHKTVATKANSTTTAKASD